MTEKELPITIHICGGDHCPKGGEHQWDGDKEWTDEYGCFNSSVACSKCGLTRMDYDLLRGE